MQIKILSLFKIHLILLFFLTSFAFGKDALPQAQTRLDQAAALKESFQYQRAAQILKDLPHPKGLAVGGYLAKLFYLAGESKQAYELIKNQKEKNWQDYLYLGLICEDLGYLGSARQAYRDSLRLEENSIALMRLAKIYRQEKKYGQAVSFLKRLIKHDSSYRIAYYYLGQGFNYLGESRDAYRYLSRSANFYPHNIEIKTQLQQVSDKLGKDFFLQERKLKEERRKRVALSSYQEKEGIPLVRIGLAVGLGEFSFQSPAKFTIKGAGLSYQAEGNNFYTLKLTGEEVSLIKRKSGQVQARFSLPVKIIPGARNKKNYPFYVLDLIYGQKDFWHAVADKAYRGSFEVILKEGKITLVNVLSIEEYLYGVLAAEIPPSAGKEALRAQAVLARSLAARQKGRHSRQGFDFCADIHCQVYRGLAAETPATRAAVDATGGEVISFKGEVPEIFYHSNCGGCLSPHVFGQKEYLASGPDGGEINLPQSPYQQELWFVNRPDTFCASNLANFRWQRIYDPEDLNLILGTGLENLEGFKVKARDNCFRYSEIEVIWSQKAIPLKGGLAIRNYFDRLRSSAFQVELKKRGARQPNMLIFWGAGFGHGSGLCQAGAMGMAKAGYNYREILKHYYPKVQLEKRY